MRAVTVQGTCGGAGSSLPATVRCRHVPAAARGRRRSRPRTCPATPAPAPAAGWAPVRTPEAAIDDLTDAVGAHLDPAHLDTLTDSLAGARR